MYNDIKRRLEARINSVPRFDIARVAASDADAERDTGRMTAHATSELERQVGDMYADPDASEAAGPPHDAIRQFGGMRTRRQLTEHFVERLSVDAGSPKTAFDFTVPTGSRVFGPPYDREWAEGNGLAFLSRFDGRVTTIPKANGLSTAGVGFYLTTNTPALAAITPQGTYDWNWLSFADLPSARSRGGLGLTIYTDSDPQPTLSRQVVLWSASGMTVFSGQQGSGRIADAASPAFGFGPVPLAPALLNMVPGSRYLVWVWCWQTSQLGPDDAFIAFLRFAMPLITIDAGPPIIIH